MSIEAIRKQIDDIRQNRDVHVCENCYFDEVGELLAALDAAQARVQRLRELLADVLMAWDHIDRATGSGVFDIAAPFERARAEVQDATS